MRYVVFALLTLLMTACATTNRPELISPCNPLKCTNRINVNTWYVEN